MHDGSKEEKIYHHFGADRMDFSYQRSSTHQQAPLNTPKHLNLPIPLFFADDIGITIFIDKLRSDFAVSAAEFAFIVLEGCGFVFRDGTNAMVIYCETDYGKFSI